MRGRVALGGYPPRAPTDPYVDALDHTVPQVAPSLHHGITPRQTRQSLSGGVSVTPSESSMPLRGFPPTVWLLDASLPIPRVLAGRVPRLPRYYQGTPTSCRPSRRASLPSRGRYHGVTQQFAPAAATCGRRRAWGWSPGGPDRGLFRGDDRSSQVPGEPRYPFALRRAARPPRNGLEQVGRPGSKNMGKRKWGLPRNLGAPVVSTEDFPEGDTE